MKRIQKYLRAMIVAGSVLGFASGWGFLAHAGKPAPTSTLPAIVAPAPDNNAFNLAPLPPLNNAPSGMQPLPSLPPMSSMPRLRLRTGGS
jgi:hypothetical protein